MAHLGVRQVNTTPENNMGNTTENTELSELLSEGDPAPFTVVNEGFLKHSPILIICDHAGQNIPRKLNHLGVDDTDLKKHIAWDIGTKRLGRALSNALKAPCVMANYSRLVMDVNRPPEGQFAMPEVSDHIRIPGNEGLTNDHRLMRKATFYDTYHGKVTECLNTIKAAGRTPLLISVHSFTPEMNGQKRDTELGILWNENKDISVDLIETLRTKNPDVVIGDNTPYSVLGTPHFNHTICKHGLDKQNGNVTLEFRQDLIESDEGNARFAQIFLDSFTEVFARHIA